MGSNNDENMLFVPGVRVADLYFVEFWRLFKHWRFWHQVALRAQQRKAGEVPALGLALREDDSWVRPFFNPSCRKCREKKMLMSLHVPSRVDLNVPFIAKDHAKSLGARWDAEKKVWYAPEAQPRLLARWGA